VNEEEEYGFEDSDNNSQKKIMKKKKKRDGKRVAFARAGLESDVIRKKKY
jgi:hypothetical protein